MPIHARFAPLHGPALLLGVALVAGSCTLSAPRNRAWVRDYGAGPAACELTIENNGFSDVHVFALMGDHSRIRLGTVSALDTRRVRLPTALVAAGTFRLLGVPAAAGRLFESDLVYADEGLSVVWRIENQRGLSTVVIR